MVPAYTEALIAAASADKRIVALDGDLVLDTGLIPFREKFPDRFVECGIAEMDMVSQAGGMALQGLLPLVHSFACFLSPRPAEQIFNNATEHSKVIYVGFARRPAAGRPRPFAPVGERYCACTARFRALKWWSRAAPTKSRRCSTHLLKTHDGSGYLRLVSIPCEIPYRLPAGYKPVPGTGVELSPGKGRRHHRIRAGDVAAGLPAPPKYCEQAHGLDVAVVNLPWLNRIDLDWLRKTLDGRRAVFTLDNHFVSGGQGRMIGAAVAALGLDRPVKVHNFGLTDFPACGQNDEVLRAHGLDAESLAAAMASHLMGKTVGAVP